MVPLLQLACSAQGGLDYWRSLARVDVHLRVRPNLFRGKFYSPAPRALVVRVDTRRVFAELAPFPAPGFRGIFAGDEVRIESDDGKVVRSATRIRADARRRFVWNDLHALYFFGYAFWNYTYGPFLFTQAGFDVRETTRAGRFRRLLVRYPPGFPTHCREQVFSFDEQGILHRLDYTAEIFGWWVRGAHFLTGHRSFGGLVYPTHRIVHPLLPGGIVFPLLTAIEGWIDDVSVVPA